MRHPGRRQSVYGDLLQFGDPKWLGTLRTGLLTVLWGTIAFVVISVLGGVAMAAIGAGRGGQPDAAANVAMQVLALVGGLVIAAGTWMMTAPDPSGLGEAKYGTIRQFVRVAVAVGLLKTLFDLCVAAADPNSDMLQVVIVAGIVAGLLQMVGFLAQVYYVGQLAARLPDPTLTARAKTIMWGLGISYGVIIAMAVVMAVVGFSSIGDGAGGGAVGGMVGGACVMGVAGIALLVFAIMYLVMVGQLANRVGQAKAYSEGVWAQAVGQPAHDGMAPGAVAPSGMAPTPPPFVDPAAGQPPAL